MNNDLLAVITELKGLVTDGPDTVDVCARVYNQHPITGRRPFSLSERMLLRGAVCRYAHVDHLSDWLPDGTPKGWVLGELDRLAEFVTGDDT